MTALYDVAAHEPLDAKPWDDAKAATAVDEIVAEALAAFDAQLLWPMHPRDLDGDEPERSRGATSLYLGAAGMAWALHRLTGASPIGPRELVEAFDAAPDLAHMTHGLLLGETGVLLAAHAIGGKGLDDRLERSLRTAIGAGEREFMWAAAGALAAAVALHERTGDERWRSIAETAVEELWRTFLPNRELGCRVWVQDLYGRVRRFVGPVHGFAGNAAALLRSGELLADERRAELEHESAVLLSRLARRDGGLANWPALVDDETLTRVQFCHGAPGMVCGLDGIPLGRDTRVDDLLVAGGELTWAAGPIARGPGLCHGTSGNGYAFLKLHRRTGDERWLERARVFGMHAIGQVARERQSAGHGRYALWTGDVGVALYLRDCAAETADVPTFDVF